jgi:hypothetical protein
MRKIMTICAMLGAFAGLGMTTVNKWDGWLVDRNCFNRSKNAKACGPRRNSDSYLLVNPKAGTYRLDRATDERTRLALRARAGRANNIRPNKSTPVFAQMKGRMRSNGRIRADIIRIQ